MDSGCRHSIVPGHGKRRLSAVAVSAAMALDAWMPLVRSAVIKRSPVTTAACRGMNSRHGGLHIIRESVNSGFGTPLTVFLDFEYS
jgi:hypothetical protein